MDEGNDSTPRVVEKLDVENEEARQMRIQSFLERLNTNTAKASNPMQPPSMPRFDFGDRSTFSVQPSELLSRVQAFLPQMEASNVLLNQRAEQDPTSIDIEHVSENMEHYIEMNLGLGLFEDRSKHSGVPASEADQEEEDSGSEMSTSSSDEDDLNKAQGKNNVEIDSGDEYDSDASSEIITSFVPLRPIKPLPRRSRPEIVVLEEQLS